MYKNIGIKYIIPIFRKNKSKYTLMAKIQNIDKNHNLQT